MVEHLQDLSECPLVDTSYDLVPISNMVPDLIPVEVTTLESELLSWQTQLVVSLNILPSLRQQLVVERFLILVCLRTVVLLPCAPRYVPMH